MDREHLHSNVYIDYENIFELLRQQKTNPLTAFSIILNKLKESFNIVDCIAYSNFEKKEGRHQTILQNLGIQTRHTANNGLNSTDIMLTVDALTILYRNSNIKVFVIISSDRDMIPLLKAIRYENRLTYVISTRSGFNPVVLGFADYHEFIEDILDLSPAPESPNDKLDFGVIPAELTLERIKQVKELCQFLYSSKIWNTHETTGEVITLKGYIPVVSKIIDVAKRDFEIAHHLGFLELYQDERKGLCIRKGQNYKEIT
ncbi:MAG: NYN domain-containing protein, partial [Firmicutes bacterium]|nr:NYN domain-containing protein [Bacillota bacterium]